jgi:hypothetical protein
MVGDALLLQITEQQKANTGKGIRNRANISISNDLFQKDLSETHKEQSASPLDSHFAFQQLTKFDLTLLDSASAVAAAAATALAFLENPVALCELI